MAEGQIETMREQAENGGKGSIEYKIARFVHILRHLGVRASLAETVDAVSALTKIDLLERNQVKGVLKACLAKSRREAGIFEQAFDLFFTTSEEKLHRHELLREMQEARNRNIAGAEQELMGVMEEWQHNLPEKIALTDQQLETFSLLPDSEKGRMKDILEQMKSNPVNNPGDLINRVLMSSLNYWRYYMMKYMPEKGGSVRPELEAGFTGDEELDDVIRNVASQFYHHPGDRILHQDMEKLDDADLPRITSLINHISAQLARGMSRRYKQGARAIAVDMRRTVRRNIKYGGIPIELRYRCRRRKKPKFLLICDVSASMARSARFVLQFMYGLSSALVSIENFIFSEDLERITQYFEGKKNFAASMAEIMNASRQWGKTTNLHRSLASFNLLYRDKLLPETVVFIVSDAKTVSPEGAADLLQELKLRCGGVIWLNTLPAGEWEAQAPIGMFRRIVDMYECNTLSQLERAMRRHVLKKI